jgi:hypothetical protein
LSWKGVVIGDPLYRPFALDAGAQWARRADLPSAAEPYARIRHLRLLEGTGDRAGAIALGLSGMRQNPSLPLALTLADLQLAAADAPGARRTLGVFAGLPKWREVDRPLVLAAAQSLGRAQDAPAACRLLQRLLADASLPVAFRRPALRQAIELAIAAREPSLVSKWKSESALLDAPPGP